MAVHSTGPYISHLSAKSFRSFSPHRNGGVTHKKISVHVAIYPFYRVVQFSMSLIWVFHDYQSLKWNEVKNSILWDITPCSPLKKLFTISFMLVSCLLYSSTFNKETTRSSETSVDFQRTARYYIPKDRTFHNHRIENLKCFK
jgi:hypothetical protein